MIRTFVCKRGGLAVAAILMATAGTLPGQGEEFLIDAAKLSDAIVAETNAYRASKGIPALKTNSSLQAAAEAYAKFLAQSEGAGHTADGQTPAKRVSAQGLKFCYVAENMYGGWRRPNPLTVEEAAQKAMDGWKKSPGHNVNLLDKRGHYIGVGAAAWTRGDRVVFRVIQDFGDECHARPLLARATKKAVPPKKPAS